MAAPEQSKIKGRNKEPDSDSEKQRKKKRAKIAPSVKLAARLLYQKV